MHTRAREVPTLEADELGAHDSQHRLGGLVVAAGRDAEQARVAIRGVRRDGMDTLKKLEKDGEIGEDDAKMWHDEIQNLTDASIKKVDEALAQKTKEILQV